ncbi:hypothetical protein V1525DRAFT_429169 [Lipomyces kononenkoae]|uniref:Uncharacterized protein n=1 Tax=Lipomyces kononenkoae TaxID=34357 RepID=A0ACC3TBU8_LIPKO
MAGDVYANVSGGGLRLKGGKIEKKKKKKSHKVSESSSSSAHDAAAPIESTTTEDLKSATPEVDNKTNAERKFEETKRKRLEKILEKKASKSHREEVEEYNKYLSGLTDHNDMPKVRTRDHTSNTFGLILARSGLANKMHLHESWNFPHLSMLRINVCNILIINCTEIMTWR